MDWWDHMEAETLAETRVWTIDFVPASCRAAVASAREAAAAYILEAEDARGRACRRGWLLLLATDRLLFAGLGNGAPGAVSVNEGLRGRLDLFWAGSWGDLWRASSGGTADQVAGAAAAASSTRRRIERLLRQNQLSRAIAAVADTGTRASGREVLEAFRRQAQPRTVEGGVTGGGMGGAAVSADGGDALELALTGLMGQDWGHLPRGTGAGPLGCRFELWGALGVAPPAGRVVAAAVARLATGRVPEDVLTLALGAALSGVPKKQGGVRIIAAGTAARRIVGRAACRLVKKKAAGAVGPFQFGVGRRRGGELLHQIVSARAQLHPQKVILALDARAAFPSVHRQAVLAGVARYLPELSVMAQAWLGRPSTHWAQATGGGAATQHEGVDMGCPLAPLFFALATRTAMEALVAAVLAADPDGAVWAYLDDVYVQVDPAQAQACFEAAAGPLRSAACTSTATRRRCGVPRRSTRPSRIGYGRESCNGCTSWGPARPSRGPKSGGSPRTGATSR